MPYTIEEHIHRGAVWDAGRAASVKGCRFKVTQAKAILERCGFNIDRCKLETLPGPTTVDARHLEWRTQVIDAACRLDVKFTHGVAAKLINCYLKARFLCAGYHEHERVKCLHPPIDAVLLDELARKNVGGFQREWRRFYNMRWSKFDAETYQSVIDQIRRAIPGRSLWEIEEYWQGYQ
jgi:hypothetical protein